MNKTRVALILSLFALGLAGCGDDEDDVGTVPTVPLSVPGGDTTEEVITTDTTVDTVPEVPVTPPPTDTPAPVPETPDTPDTPQNDTPPPAGSEAEQFENFCAENPGAC